MRATAREWLQQLFNVADITRYPPPIRVDAAVIAGCTREPDARRANDVISSELSCSYRLSGSGRVALRQCLNHQANILTFSLLNKLQILASNRGI